MATHKTLRDFYRSREWTSLRMMLMAQRGPVCEMCGNLITNSTNLIGHHTEELTPENIHDHNISLNPDKVKLICRDCHDREHQRFGYVNVGRQVLMVYGPPLSGKTTFVQQNKTRTDLVIDINQLFSAVTGLPEYDKPDSLLPIVRQVQAQLLDMVKTRFGKWSNAWIVGGYADKHQREKVIEDTGAEPIQMETTKEECMARLRSDPRLQHRQSEYEEYINRWFDRYRP